MYVFISEHWSDGAGIHLRNLAGMMALTFNPKSQEAGRSMRSRPAWSSEQDKFQDGQGHTEKPSQKQ